ncbi:MAG: GTP pyrophosphokinase family protein [Christensenellales bacterium]
MEEIKEVKFAPGLTADILFVELQSQGREYLRLMSYYSSAMLEMETKFKVLNIEFSNKFDRNPIESIETRLKKPRSIYEKMNRLGLPISVDAIEKNLNDIAGVRVICSFGRYYKLADMLAYGMTSTSFRRRTTSKPERERLSQSAYDYGSTDFLSTKSGTCAWRCSANDCDGFRASLEHKLRYKKTFPPRRQTRL